MKIYSRKAFHIAQVTARDAVRGGSARDYDFDWGCAMWALKIAYGYAPLTAAGDFYNEG